MTTKNKIVPALCILAAFVAGVWWFHGRSASPEKESADAEGEKVKPVARVQVVKIERKTMTETVTAYGSVIAQPGKTHSVSVSFETRVRQILVAPGQLVKEDDPLAEIEASPAAQLQLQQTRNAVESARKDLKQTQERYDVKLATNQDLGLAQKTARDTELQFQSLQNQGVGTDNKIRSNKTGLVSKVSVQVGQLVPAGGVLVEIVAEDEIEVKLGIEPSEVSDLTPGQAIGIIPVNHPAAGKVDGTIRLVTGMVEPTTRLVDVYVSLPPGTKLLLSGYVRGEIAKISKDALVVPRSALLPDDDTFALFTIRDGHAVKRTVKTGLESGSAMEIVAPDLHEGDPVVVLGNYELEDGMSVEVQK